MTRCGVQRRKSGTAGASDHPLRAIRKMVEQALGELSEHFDGLYANTGGGFRLRRKSYCGLCCFEALLRHARERLLMEELVEFAMGGMKCGTR
jgi:hypothetical protein